MANSQTFTFNIKAVADMKDVQSNIQNIQNALKQLKLPNTMQESFRKTFNELDKELERYQKLMAGGFKTKGDAGALEKSGKNIVRLYDEVLHKINSLDDADLKKAFEDLGAKEVEKLKNELTELQNKLKENVKSEVKIVDFKKAKEDLKEFKSDFENAGDTIEKTWKTLSNSTINSFTKNLTEGNLELAANNLKKIEGQVETLKSALSSDDGAKLDDWLTNLRNKFNEIKDNAGIKETAEQVQELKQALANAKADVLQGLVNSFKEGKISAEQFGQSVREVTQANDDLAQSQANVNKEIDQIKSRIQYFFGLSNAINLVKRAIRGAFETIKELDKAMTATAVVTDFSVGDMWEQLPEYTKRANELGVTTLAAYEAATLYYQQGLKTNEVNALSIETLKMARIAGLDAAEATDRMTNALRGFNMELTQANAQRVDDVYSELAANTASNVDEISTAMTKVASLAHNANMEFETTAAFLSQIIETTRESAETAGTALKTVVARFSEVKKLYTEDQIRGTDEEGQVIDVNRVGAALRSAGIDLNKYFLGEVGLDDIFMELASKWDTLTSVQQRYIATQAAGSRQQSRFIALMQDYARTQELVGKAYNANGASARQFAKTQESLESKLNRLKNAWNEFLMGLTNSTVVKGFVDLLTNLLNVINKLTSAFGEGVGSILKWVSVIGAISGGKALFNSAGFGNLLSIFTGPNKKGFLNSENVKASVQLGGEAIKGWLEKIGEDGGLKEAFNGLFKGLSEGVSENISKLSGIFDKAKAGISSLSGATLGLIKILGVLAIAVGAVAAAYGAWYALSPKGQLKQAEKYASAMNIAASNAQKNVDELKEAQKAYESYTEAVKKASTVEERRQAINDRNDYVSSLVEQNEALAKYVNYSREGNQLVLTVNEAEIKAAAEEAARGAEQAAINANFANAFQAGMQARVYEQTGGAVSQQAAQNSLNESYNYARTAYQQALVSSGIENEIADSLAKALASSFNSRQFLEEVNLQRFGNLNQTRAQLEAEYKRLYGTEVEQGTKRADLARAVAQGQINRNRTQTADELAKLIESSDSYKKIFDAISGEAINSLESINLDSIFEDLKLDETSDEFKNFARLMGKSNEELKQYIKILAAQTNEIRKQKRVGIFEILLRNGIQINDTARNTINQWSPEVADRNFEILQGASRLFSDKVQTDLYNSLLNGDITKDIAVQLQNLLNSIDLEDPIDALNKLKEASGGALDKYIEDIKTTNAELFTNSNLVQSFIASSDYDSLTDSLKDFIEENGSITSKNINELAESNSKLKQLIDANVVSTKALANALTLIEKGTIGFNTLTDALLEALSVGTSFQEVLDDVSSWIDDFSEGENLAKGSEHITDLVEDALEYVEDWQFGNQPLENIFNHFFGTEDFDYTKFMEENWGKPYEELERILREKFNEINSLADNEGLGALQKLNGTLGITGNGTEFTWDLSEFKTNADAIAKVAESLQISNEAAEAIILSWSSHMYDFRQEWDARSRTEQVQAYITEAQKRGFSTQEELDALGITSTELEELNLKLPVTIDFQSDNLAEQLKGSDIFADFNDLVKNGTLNYQDALSAAIADGLTSAQANAAIDAFAETTKTALSGAAQVLKEEDGTYTIEPEMQTADSVAALQKAIEVAEQNANWNLVAENLANVEYTSFQEALEEAARGGVTTGINAAVEGMGEIPLQFRAIISGLPGSMETDYLGATNGVARGGLVKSLATGTSTPFLQPGFALTGEEGAEIVWNKDKGYAYVTGKNGPEFQNLQPGDRVFNAAETERIFRNSSFAKGGYFGSYAKGGWKEDDGNGAGGGSGSGDDTDWRNELDWLYDLMEDIAEYERQQTIIQSRYDLTLKDLSATGRDLYNLTREELINLETQLDAQEAAAQKRLQQMNELQDQINAAGYGKYIQWNGEDQTLEIDWDAIEDITDKDTYDEVTDWLSRAETVQDQIDEAINATWDIKKQIQELQDRYLQQYLDFQKRVLDAVVKQYQQQIDNLSELNSTLTDTNNEILNAIQKEIDLERQIRDNTDTESNIANMEARLAYLQRDTTGANATEIRQLEKQLEEARQNYSDTLVDQAIDRLSESNEEAAKQRDKQIELMQAQLDYWQESGGLWDEVYELIATGFTSDGTIIDGSELVRILQQAEDYESLSQAQKDNWGNELILATNEVGAHIITLAEGMETSAEQVRALLEELTSKLGGTPLHSYHEMPGGAEETSGGSGGSSTGSSRYQAPSLTEKEKTDTEKQIVDTVDKAAKSASKTIEQAAATAASVIANTLDAAAKAAAQKEAEIDRMRQHQEWANYTFQWTPYATGGLSTRTGPAWLDGTPSEPEYVLNARQTDAFLRLAEVLPAAMNSNPSVSTTYGSNNTFNIAVNVDSISDDYDVDKLVDRIKDDLANAASYRNVNALSFIR